MSNPLLDTTSLPRFTEIQPRDVIPAISGLIAEQRQRLEQLLSDEALTSFDELVIPLEDMSHLLSRVWSPVSHLQSVTNDSSWRNAYNEALPLLSQHSTEVAQNKKLHDAFARIEESFAQNATEAQRSLVQQALRDFRLAGVALPDDRKRQFADAAQELATTQAAFEQRLQDASDNWQLHITDEARLKGLPEQAVRRAASQARDANLEGWKLTLDYPNYHAIMTHAEDRELRETFYRAWATRASDQADNPQWDNSANIERILALRQQIAELVGLGNYAEYSIATKMAATVPEVLEFLRELARRSKTAAAADFAELEALAGQPLQPWDTTYYLEKLKEDKYAVSDEALRQYFPAHRVMTGLFDLAGQLFGVKLETAESNGAWHDSVEYLVVRDKHDQIIGGFYIDLYARSGKRSGAWVDECVIRKSLADQTELPIGYLVCNFSPPSENNPSLLTHDEVVTLFHEFGHMLHHLLTRVDYPSIAGINGVPWDAVELPSQFMENFAWCYEVLEKTSGHHKTGERLPRDLFDRLEKSRTLGAGLAMVRQLELALFDFRLHAEFESGKTDVLQLLSEVRDETAVIKHPAYNRLPHSFSHIFAGGYAAGYYSYKWAEVLAADAFSAFEEEGVFNATTASRFRKEILEVGGSRDIMAAYVAFRGRKPTLDALLKQSGIAI